LPRSKRSRRGRIDGPPVPREAWLCLAACTAAAALLQIDGTLITVALPKAAHGLKVSNASTSVVLTAYFVAYALMLIPGGVLVDRFGARRLALTGLGLFAVGAAGGAVSSSLGVLIGTRVIQGIGAGLVSPAALAGAVSGFPPARRGAALGIWGASAGMANLVGPLLGGLLTIALGWRADWWALVPLALLAAAAIVRHLPAARIAEHDDPVGPGGRVVNQIVLAASCVAALTFAVMIGTFYLAEQYLQRSRGFSALGASAVLVFVALLVGFAAPVAGRLVDQRGERLTAILGFLLTALGLAVLAIPSVSLSSPATMVPLVPVGVGLGLLFVPASRAALNSNPSASHGRTSAVLSMGRLLGAGVGAALAGVAISGGPTASTLHTALLVAALLCAIVGIPAASVFGPFPRSASEAAVS
jgi:MFS family permease